MKIYKRNDAGRDVIGFLDASDASFLLRKDQSDESAGKITAKGFDAKGEKITSVADPTNASDAVNLGFLNRSGVADKTYTHTQSEALESWYIRHGLNKRPSIETFDASGNYIKGVVKHLSENESKVTFQHANIGVAYCN